MVVSPLLAGLQAASQSHEPGAEENRVPAGREKGFAVMLAPLLAIRAGSPLLGRSPARAWGLRHTHGVWGKKLGAAGPEQMRQGQL